jgi:hypothetical protein
MNFIVFFISLAFLEGLENSHVKLNRFIQKSIYKSILLATSISLTSPVLAVGLGEHSGCAYPACTSQLEVFHTSLKQCCKNYYNNVY